MAKKTFSVYIEPYLIERFMKIERKRFIKYTGLSPDAITISSSLSELIEKHIEEHKDLLTKKKKKEGKKKKKR